jgi:hypothetical protein
MPIFYDIITKTFPRLKSFLSLKETCSYGLKKPYDFYDKISNNVGYYTYFEMSFPQDYRDDILIILKFCGGIYVEKEEYDSSGICYFTFREI